MSETLRAVEFYCGIGGLHLALQRARPSARVVASYDVNTVGNEVYAARNNLVTALEALTFLHQHNFGLRPSARDVRALTPAELDAHSADIWLLSPPCQPYTRQGLQLGKADGRVWQPRWRDAHFSDASAGLQASSFACLLAAMQRMKRPPARLLVENVVGFENSETRTELLVALSGYVTAEVILSPSQFGVPYSRPRYYLLAARKPAPGCRLSTPLAETPWRRPLGITVQPRRSLSEYLQADDDGSLWDEYAVPWAAVRSSLLAVDVAVQQCERDLNCFTKSYGKYAKGTGSLLARGGDDVRLLFDAVERAAADAQPEGLDAVGALGKCIATLPGWPMDAPPLRCAGPIGALGTIFTHNVTLVHTCAQVPDTVGGIAAARISGELRVPSTRDAPAALRAAGQFTQRGRGDGPLGAPIGRLAALTLRWFSVNNLCYFVSSLTDHHASCASAAISSSSARCSIACIAATASPISPCTKPVSVKLQPLRWSDTRLSL